MPGNGRHWWPSNWPNLANTPERCSEHSRLVVLLPEVAENVTSFTSFRTSAKRTPSWRYGREAVPGGAHPKTFEDGLVFGSANRTKARAAAQAQPGCRNLPATTTFVPTPGSNPVSTQVPREYGLRLPAEPFLPADRNGRQLALPPKSGTCSCLVVRVICNSVQPRSQTPVWERTPRNSDSRKQTPRR
jgi:hypothetical protein